MQFIDGINRGFNIYYEEVQLPIGIQGVTRLNRIFIEMIYDTFLEFLYLLNQFNFGVQ